MRGFPKVLGCFDDTVFMKTDKSLLFIASPVATQNKRNESAPDENATGKKSAEQHGTPTPKVAMLREAIAAGTYKVNPDNILRGLLERGDLA